MEEKPNYYSIIPANVRYNDNLNSSQKLFYGEITSLTQKTGECWASNNYFSQLYNVSPSSISNWVKKLEEEELIEVQYIKEGREIKQRIIRLRGIQNIDYLFNKLDGGIQNIEEGYSKNLKENNTSKNNTSINNIYSKKFKKPTLEEVKEYCQERNSTINPEEFYNYYESVGWKRGNTTMKSWKNTIVSWELKQKQRENNKPTFNTESARERAERLGLI